MTQLASAYPGFAEAAYESGGLDSTLANLMVENCIGKLSLPLGLALDFRINGRDLRVPMCVEEPSVIAAASFAAKTIKTHSQGFSAWSTDSLMVGQVQLLHEDPEAARLKLEAAREQLLSSLG